MRARRADFPLTKRDVEELKRAGYVPERFELMTLGDGKKWAIWK